VRRSRYRVALFDLDDTLFDHQLHRRQGLRRLQEAVPALREVAVECLEKSHEVHLQATHAAVLDNRLDLAQARMERMRLLLADFGQRAPDALLRTCQQSYQDGYGAPRHVVPGAAELLRLLRRQLGMSIAVITNGSAAEQTRKLQVLQLDQLVDAVLTSEAAGCRKPAPAFYLFALSQLQAQPAEVVALGDLWEVDILGALGAGIDAIWLNRYGHGRMPSVHGVRCIRGFVPLEDTLRLFE
jgi:putative hydrolase of the HAD superfamily